MRGMNRPSSRLIGTGLVVFGMVAGQGASLCAESETFADRLVHRFDFDERDDGNLEDIPKYWLPIRLQGFPGYAIGSFDFDVGRSAPPSFHLAANGRNIALEYTGPETLVRVHTDYRVEAFVRPDRLLNARACLSACFLNSVGKPILSTLRRTRYIGGSQDSDDWHRLELYLPDAPVEARSIGLTAWVLQESVWNMAPSARRPISRNDVNGGAWFDDLSVYALPMAVLESTAPGNVLMPPESFELLAIIADTVRVGLSGQLTIRDADGHLVETHSIPAVQEGAAEPTRISVAHLAPGLYDARLDVMAGDNTIATRHLRFARLAHNANPNAVVPRSFGVVIRPDSRTHPEIELSLLTRQAVGAVKLPVWTGLSEEPPAVTYRSATDTMLQSLVKDGVELTGVLAGPPTAIVRSSGPYPRPLIELLADEPSEWEDHLAAVVAPYAGVFRWWQVGSDGSDALISIDRLAKAVEQIRTSMRRFITLPTLAMPFASGWRPSDTKYPVEQLSLTLDAALTTDAVATHVRQLKASGYSRVSVVVEPPSSDLFDRRARLAAWARRVIEARHSGLDTVFVPQTWRIRQTERLQIAEPTEEFILLRTMAGMIGDAVPGPAIELGDGARCLAFHDVEETILALWDEHAPLSGRPHVMQLGEARQQVDLWGVAQPLERDDTGRQIIMLYPEPVLIGGVDRRLIDLRTAITLQPMRVESGTEFVQHGIDLLNDSVAALSGEVQLSAPDSWKVSPNSFRFDLMPQRKRRFDVGVEYPHNAPAGEKSIIARITLTNPPYYLEVPLVISIGLADVDVWGSAVVEGGHLVLRQVITNRSDGVLHFRGSANVPGRQRQHRPVVDLRPGDTQGVLYRFEDGEALIGKLVMLSIREMNDGPRTHNLEIRVP